MKFLHFVLFLLISCLPALSQVKDEASPDRRFKNTGNTYAVIIGIANYESKNIPNLNFPNKDARVFAEYLQSKAGGSVPTNNIRLLIDTTATTAAIYNALNWLREKCDADKEENKDKENLIYFYFSGHGDLETDTKANLGFLLSYNTPANNYINNAVRLEDLNIYANTLSINFNANVVLITDACHSGKLAGSDNRGTYLVGKELSTVRAKEIRIAACAPEELSQENEGWGGGRGIFSYYLVNGLKGLADYNHDSVVTLSEIKNYLDSSISSDAIMKDNRLTQTPVLKGDEKFKLAEVNPNELLVVQQSAAILPPESTQDYFFSLLKQRDRLESLDFAKLNSLRKEEIPFAFIKQVLKDQDTTIRLDKIQQLEKTLQANKEELKLFTETLVDVLHTSGQEIINLYLQGDAAELERRRYYNSKSSGYDMYPSIYALAIKLTAPDNPLLRILKVNHYYFTGVAARLKMPTVPEPKQRQLIEEALAAQKKALELEDGAAYIYNELGILSQAKMENAAAEKYYITALKLAPEWAIPWANLSGLYGVTKNFEKAIKAGQTADGLQPDLQSTNANFGFIYESTDNWLFAEEFYRKAIDINSRHYYPFERLGYVYMNTTQYAQADSFFHEAEIRKKGYHFNGDGFDRGPILLPPLPMNFSYCDLDTSVLKIDDIMAFFYWGHHDEYDKKKYTNAVRVFKKIIAVDKTNPLVFHYMGKIFYDQQKWEDAEVMFKLATRYYLDPTAFKKYCDSVIQHGKFPYAHDCFEDYFRNHYYQKIEDYYFLATLYESWAHYEEAEAAYRTIIKMSPDNIGGYVKLWRMLEKLGRYTEAEKIIQSYAVYDKEQSILELNDFYRRTSRQFPEEGAWPYKLGLLLYERAAARAYTSYLDTIVWFPLLNREVFIDVDVHNSLNTNAHMLVAGKTPNKPPEIIEVDYLLDKPGGIELPGTHEYLVLANSIIYTPRKDGISFLLKADSLLTETEVKADINFKIGNLYVWSGSKKQAWPYYTKSVQLVPDNASARLSFIDVSKALYKNRAAFEQLNYLYDKQQINFPNRLLLAEFCILSGQFEKGKKILEEAQAIHPYVLSEIADLTGRMYFLSQKPVQAIPFYKNFLATHTNDRNTLYTLAKLYAQTGNKPEAWKWLKEAMKSGFNYSYVLNSDATWNDFRKTGQWSALMKQFVMKKYAEPVLN